MDREDLLLIGGIGIALYLFLKKAPAVPGVATAVDAYSSFTNFFNGSYGGTPTGTIQMPNGGSIPSSAIQMTNMSTNEFSYGGNTYTLMEDADGNFVAQ